MAHTTYGTDLVLTSATADELDIDNININGNTISSTDTNGDIALIPDGSGNVGIGTTNPQRLLDISGDGTQLQLTHTTSDNQGRILMTSGEELQFFVGNGGTLTKAAQASRTSSHGEWKVFNSAGTTRVFLNSNGDSYINGGQLGVGLTSPSSPLHVDQSSSTGAIPVVKLDQGDTSEPFIDFIGTAAGDAVSSISTLTTSGSTTHHIQIDINGTKAWVAASTTDPS
jgi:hypothetical protein